MSVLYQAFCDLASAWDVREAAIKEARKSAIEERLLGDGLPLGFPNTMPTSALYRAYLWGKRNQERLAISGQMALSNITRELAQRGVRLEVGHGN